MYSNNSNGRISSDERLPIRSAINNTLVYNEETWVVSLVKKKDKKLILVVEGLEREQNSLFPKKFVGEYSVNHLGFISGYGIEGVQTQILEVLVSEDDQDISDKYRDHLSINYKANKTLAKQMILAIKETESECRAQKPPHYPLIRDNESFSELGIHPEACGWYVAMLEHINIPTAAPTAAPTESKACSIS